MATARGQVTITDLNDGKQVFFCLTANKSLKQTYKRAGKKYEPDFVSDALVITPDITVSGKSGNAMESASQAPVWTVREDDTVIFRNSMVAAEAVSCNGISVGATAPYALSIARNISGDTLQVRCATEYYDASSNMSLVLVADASVSKSTDSGAMATADILSSGTIFKNNSEPASITLTPVLNRGGEEDATPGGVSGATFTAEWYKDAVTAAKKIGSEAGKYAIDGGVLTVYPGGVDSVNQFFVRVTDTDPVSATYGNVYVAGCTIVDMTDTYRVEISSDCGYVFRNGAGKAITLTATVKHGKKEVLMGLVYKWTVTDAQGNSTTYSGSERTFTVTPEMVDGQANIQCEVTIESSMDNVRPLLIAGTRMRLSSGGMIRLL